MIFLLQYDRAAGKLMKIVPFLDSQRDESSSARLSLELELNHTKIGHEVVLLEAASEEALRKTHRRYFENLDTLARTA